MGIFRRSRALVGLAALVAVTACTTWQPYSGPPGQAQLPSQVRVTLVSGEQVTLRDPVVLGDTLLHGLVDRQGQLQEFPMSGIQLLEARRFSGGKTALLVLASAVVVGGTIYGIALYQWTKGD